MYSAAHPEEVLDLRATFFGFGRPEPHEQQRQARLTDESATLSIADSSTASAKHQQVLLPRSRPQSFGSPQDGHRVGSDRSALTNVIFDRT
jgi:hypothetical protein